MGETTTALEWRLAHISHSDLVDMSAAAHSPEGPPWPRAETGTEAWSPRPCCSLLGHRRPAVTRCIDVFSSAALAGESMRFVLRLHMHVRHAVP